MVFIFKKNCIQGHRDIHIMYTSVNSARNVQNLQLWRPHHHLHQSNRSTSIIYLKHDPQLVSQKLTRLMLSVVHAAAHALERLFHFLAVVISWFKCASRAIERERDGRWSMSVVVWLVQGWLLSVFGAVLSNYVKQKGSRSHSRGWS